MSLVTVHASRLAGHQTDLDNLSADEHERAAAFVFDRDRRRYQECHVRLRHQLGHYLDTTPESLAIITGPFGKPELEGTPCHFNLSHSGDLYAAAFHPEHPIGIDIETGETNGDDLLDLVPHVCHATEKAALERLQDPSEQRRLFLCYWTAKEAFLKAIGCGFQHAPETVQIVGDPFSKTATVEASIPGTDSTAWTLHFLSIADSHVLTVAAPRGCLVELRETPFDA